MIDQLTSLDTQIFLALNGLHSVFLDPAMLIFTGRAIWIPLYVAIAYVVVRRFGLWRGLLLVALIGAAVGLSDFICAQAIRPHVARLRPANPDGPLAGMVHIVNGYRSGGHSFPSCHAANTFALAVGSTIILRSRPYAIFIFIWAALQCYSRIYLGVHYPFDILAGAIVGSAIALAACLPARRLAKEPAYPMHGPWVAIAVGIATIIAVLPLSWV